VSGEIQYVFKVSNHDQAYTYIGI